jgi:hypothetical protein
MGSINKQKHNPYIEGKYGHLNPNDVVFTPDWLAKQIIDMFNIKGKILEPCKGEGAFLQYLPPNTDWCEITEGKNFYDYNRFLEHSFELADNIVLLVPVAKMFKSMGTMSDIFNYGGFVEIHTLPSSKAGFPFGFPSAVYYLKRGYKGDTKIKMLDGIKFIKRKKKNN